MVHNGIEYGMMQAYAEGFDIFDKSELRPRQREDRAPLEAGLGRALVAAASSPPRAFEQEGNDLAGLEPATSADSGEGRWTIEDAIDQRRARRR